MTKRIGIMLAVASLVSLATAVRAEDWGSVRGTGGSSTQWHEANTNDGTWVSASTGTYTYGSLYNSAANENSDVQWANKQSDRQARQDAQRAQLRAERERKAAERASQGANLPTSYRSELQTGHLRVDTPGRGRPTADQQQDRAVDARRPTPVPTPFESTIPEGMTPVGLGDELYYYKACEFYTLAVDALVKVAPPVGAMVFELADSAVAETKDGVTAYQCGDAIYHKSLLQGTLVYRVVAVEKVE